MVKADITKSKIDWEQGSFYGEVKWHGSWEAESHLDSFGISKSTACWSLVGYASGYVSRFFKRFIIFKEIQCCSQGHDYCLVEGKPAEEWEDEEYNQFFKPNYTNTQFKSTNKNIIYSQYESHKPHINNSLIGSSPKFMQLLSLLEKAAITSINVLLLGETGVGKEVFSRRLHELSDRSNQPFISINCGAIPENLIESELFGVRKGAFTDAQQSRPGRFERANKGTLLLDEVGELSLSAQVKLLRVIQTGEVERLGDDQVRQVDVRIVAATNIDLKKAIKNGTFRADLYYRLSIYPLEIPPLRDRKTDIPLFIEKLIAEYSTTYKKSILGISDKGVEALVSYQWPGNIRELENTIERAVLLTTTDNWIETEQLFPDGLSYFTNEVSLNLNGHINSIENDRSESFYNDLIEQGLNLPHHEICLLEAAVSKSNGNLTHAARLLGITRRQLAYRLKNK
jgi:transcriptional regulator with PAS, ATPase and Fis domain